MCVGVRLADDISLLLRYPCIPTIHYRHNTTSVHISILYTVEIVQVMHHFTGTKGFASKNIIRYHQQSIACYAIIAMIFILCGYETTCVS